MAGLTQGAWHRIGDAPLVALTSHPSLGDNINGPSLIRVPEWVRSPLGRYYLYFAHHEGRFIRLAYADRLSGPWTVHPPGVLHIDDTPFEHHIASPDVHVDHASQRIWMHYHGEGAAGAERFPFAQPSCYAESDDGLRFASERTFVAEFYLRTFAYDGWWYGFSGGHERRLSRARKPQAPFEHGPRLDVPGESFTASDYEGVGEYRMRHVSLACEQNQLRIYYSNVGDCPERIKLTSVALDGDWHDWRATRAHEVLAPELPYEGVDAALRASRAGVVREPVHELRDPYVFTEAGEHFLLYACAGEQAIAIARLA